MEPEIGKLPLIGMFVKIDALTDAPQHSCRLFDCEVTNAHGLSSDDYPNRRPEELQIGSWPGRFR
jgi:hypothetical protein